MITGPRVEHRQREHRERLEWGVEGLDLRRTSPTVRSSSAYRRASTPSPISTQVLAATAEGQRAEWVAHYRATGDLTTATRASRGRPERPTRAPFRTDSLASSYRLAVCSA